MRTSSTVAAGLYAFAMIFERLDHQVYALLGGWLSGHTLKHLVACLAILRHLRNAAKKAGATGIFMMITRQPAKPIHPKDD